MILFSDRKELERRFLAWCKKNKVSVTPASMIAFFDTKDFLNRDKIMEHLKLEGEE